MWGEVKWCDRKLPRLLWMHWGQKQTQLVVYSQYFNTQSATCSLKIKCPRFLHLQFTSTAMLAVPLLIWVPSHPGIHTKKRSWSFNGIPESKSPKEYDTLILMTIRGGNCLKIPVVVRDPALYPECLRFP